jgi:hypothetical protein
VVGRGHGAGGEGGANDHASDVSSSVAGSQSATTRPVNLPLGAWPRQESMRVVHFRVCIPGLLGTNYS